MGDSPNDPLTPQSLQQQQHSSDYNLAMLYYGFFVVATAAVVLAIYHCLIVRWFADVDHLPTWHGPATAQGSESNGQKIVELVASTTTLKYIKSRESEECVVCLSVFEEGEDVRELPKCKHYFHTSCIDTWFSYHLDCPLCRTPLADRDRSNDTIRLQPENSGAGFSNSRVSV